MKKIPLQMNRVHDCMAWLERELEPTGEPQSIDALIMRMDAFCASLPFINGQMATANAVYNEKKVKAYKDMIKQFGQEEYFAPSLAKDYVSAMLSSEAYDKDLCERCSRTLTHLIDAMRTSISAMKAERQYA